MKKEKKIDWWKIYRNVLTVLMGIALGILIIRLVDWKAATEMPYSETLLSMAMLLVGMIVAVVVQTIIHEAGHLVFGLLTGYGFSSFRIFSYMWVRQDGKLRLKRHSLPGTAGQCLMSPPELVDGKMPTVLYNFGGAFLNVIASLGFLGLYFVFENLPVLSKSMILFAAVGFFLAIMNGVPMRNGMGDNDGYNALNMRKNKESMRATWIVLKVNEQIAKGIRLKDMPEEWFALSSDEAMENGMIASIAVLACNRLMDEQRFEEADVLMTHILKSAKGLYPLQRGLMVCDRIYVELITKNRREVLEKMLTQEQRSYMRQMGSFLTVLRTEYLYALLAEQDREKAARIKSRFEKRAETYPYSCDVRSERELIELGEERAV